MVTDEQVRLLMSLLNQGTPQTTAAAKAGMSERTARKYTHSGRSPSQSKAPHTWRTRPDPFAEVWLEVEALLQQDAGLQAKTIWTELNERYPGRFGAGQLRTLQRRLLAWRVRSGPDRERSGSIVQSGLGNPSATFNLLPLQIGATKKLPGFLALVTSCVG